VAVIFIELWRFFFNRSWRSSNTHSR
jgi:hypothetical protein